jgi:hypothetical protein
MQTIKARKDIISCPSGIILLLTVKYWDSSAEAFPTESIDFIMSVI